MSWLKTIFDFGRGRVNEAGEAIASDPRVAIPAMEQKIRDAEADLEKSKNALTDVMAQGKMAAKTVTNLKGKLEEYEGYAVQASDKDDTSLLNEVVDQIAEIETELTAKRVVSDGLAETVKQLKRTVVEVDRAIKSMKTEVKTVKATEYAQRAAMEVSAKYSGSTSSARLAAERLQRIKEKQAERQAKMDAARELEEATSGDDLKKKLADAGIGASTPKRDEILARIKAKKS